MVANVKQMKLITGEEILCDLTEALYDEEDGIEHTLLLRSAYTLVSHEDFENQVRYYTFKPFMMHLYEPNKVLALNAHSVICMVQPDKKVIDQYDEISIGHSNIAPEIYYGVKIGLEVKGFGMDAVFQGIANQTIYLNTSSVFRPLRNNTTISQFSANRWVPQNIEGAKAPRLSMNDNDNNYRKSTLSLVDGDYFKLRSLNVYYKFPTNLMNKLKLDNGKVFIRGMNLFSIDNIQIMDPEATNIGYPTLASCHIGVTVGL